MSRAKTAELIDMPCGCKFMGPKEPCIRWRPRSSRERDIFGVGISRPIVKYREYTACGQYSQPYSVGGSSSAAFRSQHCGNLLRSAVLRYSGSQGAMHALAAS